ncbi:ABC transporter ATP-binding protein [Candidatus Sumerlaeota bacterium]|nr:ABC transporter ATP-binding protein [Candidatus Sumerlaeota bacterium]
MLKVDNLTKDFPKVRAVDNLSFELQKGRICGFVGPNGAGKTTAMRIIATLDDPTFGKVYVSDKSIAERPYDIRRIIGFMPDHYGVYPDLSVLDYLEFYARAYEIPSSSRKRRIEQIMNFTGLDKIAEKDVETLSKGMRQRLNLGRALINDPQLLIMDEPAAGLDPRARVELRYLIKQLAEQGKTIFVSSHILTELGEICDDILIIDKGKKVAFGDVNEIQKSMQKTFEISVKLLEAPQIQGLERFLMERPGISNIRIKNHDSIIFTFSKDIAEIPPIMREMTSQGFSVIEFKPQMMTMEDVFIQITEGEF